MNLSLHSRGCYVVNLAVRSDDARVFFIEWKGVGVNAYVVDFFAVQTPGVWTIQAYEGKVLR